MKNEKTPTEVLALIARAEGDDSALGRLLERYRGKIRLAVAARLDGRVARRVDASDLVQETLADAVKKFPEFVRDRDRIGFPKWLRQLARRRIIWARRQHLGAAKRSVARDRGEQPPPETEHTQGLISGIVAPGSSPSRQVVHNEEKEQLVELLKKLPELDRTILRLRYAGQHPFPEIANRLNMGLSAVTMHHLRAIRKLRELMETP
jgi:RNA polymerase sigma-70 factor (ECF subfamily)